MSVINVTSNDESPTGVEDGDTINALSGNDFVNGQCSGNAPLYDDGLDAAVLKISTLGKSNG